MRQAVGAHRAKAKFSPDIPSGSAHLWSWFWRLHNRRQSGLEINPISLPDMRAFEQLFGVTIRPWEAVAICAMDDAYCAAIRETRPVHAGGEKGANKATPANVRSFFRLMSRGKRGKHDRHRKTSARDR